VRGARLLHDGVQLGLRLLANGGNGGAVSDAGRCRPRKLTFCRSFQRLAISSFCLTMSAFSRSITFRVQLLTDADYLCSSSAGSIIADAASFASDPHRAHTNVRSVTTRTSYPQIQQVNDGSAVSALLRARRFQRRPRRRRSSGSSACSAPPRLQPSSPTPPRTPPPGLTTTPSSSLSRWELPYLHQWVRTSSRNGRLGING
jgi:hypothetical protein